ncbi:MAG: hypothetical protein Fur0021_01220 [Candidatus Promineifilaceae bacterium]
MMEIADAHFILLGYNLPYENIGTFFTDFVRVAAAVGCLWDGDVRDNGH